VDQLRQSLLDTPVIEKEGYHCFVHPTGDGGPMLRPGLLYDPSPPSASSCRASLIRVLPWSTSRVRSSVRRFRPSWRATTQRRNT